MTIKERLTADMKQAMKSGNKQSLTVIRMLIDRVQKKEKDFLRDATEEEVVQVLQTFKKQTEEEQEGYLKAGNQDRANELQWSLQLINEYLPAMMNEDGIRMIVDVEIGKLQMVGHTVNKGNIMKWVMPILKGKAENKLIGEVIDKALKEWGS